MKPYLILFFIIFSLSFGGVASPQVKGNPDVDMDEFERLMDQQMKQSKPSNSPEKTNRNNRPFRVNGKTSNKMDKVEQRLDKLENLNRQRATTFGTRSNALSTTATGINRLFNPAISFNTLGLATYRSKGNGPEGGEHDDEHEDQHVHGFGEHETGFRIQELELNAQAYIDNYLRGSITLAMHDVEDIEMEEAFVDFVPFLNLNIRAGKYFVPFGKHAQLHTHQFPFIDAPQAVGGVVGAEFNEVGIGINPIIPLPWFSEISFNILNGDNETLFDSQHDDDFAYLIHSKNLWDLNENTTLELGGSYAFGENGSSGANNHTDVVGANMTIIYRPLNRTRFRSLIWQAEYLGAFKETGIEKETGDHNPDENIGGVYTFLQYQFLQRWWIQGRYDFLGLHNDDVPGEAGEDTHQWSALLAFANSEFQSLRLQYNYLDYDGFGDRGFDHEHQLLLQLNFTMGAHPAHLY